jgi:hypothetical protein
LIIWVESQRRLKLGSRRLKVAAQHIRIPFVIQQPDCDALQFGCGRVRLVREVKSPQSIVTCRQSDPRGHVLWRLFNCVLEILLRQAEIALVKSLDAKPRRLIRGIIFDIAGILSGRGIGVGVSPVWLHPEINNTNEITKINRLTVSTPTKAALFNPSIPVSVHPHSDSPVSFESEPNRAKSPVWRSSQFNQAKQPEHNCVILLRRPPPRGHK